MSRTWRCRMGWHSYAIRRNPESRDRAMVYLECRRCTKQKDVTGTPGAGMGGVGFSAFG